MQRGAHRHRMLRNRRDVETRLGPQVTAHLATGLPQQDGDVDTLDHPDRSGRDSASSGSAPISSKSASLTHA